MKTSPSLAVVIILSAVILAFTLTASGDENAKSGAVGASETAVEIATNPALLEPSLATETAPDAFRVKLETTKGDVVILVNRSWAPKGVDRFYNLVKIGYYSDVAFYRVIRGFMAQCGFNPDPTISAAWSRARIADDPILQTNTRGMVTFAMGGANTRTTQFFINFADNSYLKDHGAFAPFGKVISGMDVMDSIYDGYGEGAPRGRGPDQARVAREGAPYLRKSFPDLDYIIRATLEEMPK